MEASLDGGESDGGQGDGGEGDGGQGEPWGEIAPSEEAGERLVWTGRVLSARGAPMQGVLLRAWQADATGRYHPTLDDDSDPRLKAELTTGADGSYRFRTIVPGAYGGGPPHIHLLVVPPAQSRLLGALNFHPETLELWGPADVIPASGPRVQRRFEGAVERLELDLVLPMS